MYICGKRYSDFENKIQIDSFFCRCYYENKVPLYIILVVS